MSDNKTSVPSRAPRSSSVKVERNSKSRDSSKCTSPTKSNDKKIPPIKAPVGLAKGPDLKNVRSKIGSFQNVKHVPAGGEKKLVTQKLEWKAAPKVGSLMYAKHRPGGGDVKVETRKLDWKVNSKIGSLENVKHKPGGGGVKIFNERFAGSRSNSEVRASPASVRSPSPPYSTVRHTSRKSSTEAAKIDSTKATNLSSGHKLQPAASAASDSNKNSAKSTPANSTPSPAPSNQSTSRPESAKPSSATSIKSTNPPKSASKPNADGVSITNGTHTADLLGGVQNQLSQLVLDSPKGVSSGNKAPVQDLLA